RHGRLLVSGSDVVSVRDQHAQLLRVGPHVPARFAAAVLGRSAAPVAVSVPGVFPGADFPWQSRGGCTVAGPALGAGVGGAVSGDDAVVLSAWTQTLQRLWGMRRARREREREAASGI